MRCRWPPENRPGYLAAESWRHAAFAFTCDARTAGTGRASQVVRPPERGKRLGRDRAYISYVIQPMVPAAPSTRAQQARYDRVIAAAAEALSAGGQEAMEMKDLAQRAGVSLATLYRYFPSKDYVLLAVSLARYQEAARKVFAEVPRGDTVRERVANHLMREFRAHQREQHLAAALTQVMAENRRSYSSMIETTEHLHLQILRHVAAGGGPLSEQQQKLLPIVKDIFSAATRRWLAGACSPAEVKFQIEAGCQLLELPDEVVAAELERAAPDVMIRLPDRDRQPS
jgi:TetR/AcrR family transcriptional regulator, cholesterol catabolism regulator